MLAILFAAQLALSPCKPQGSAETLQCGKLTVFENRAAKSGRTIDLNVVVLPALDPKNKREPFFEIAGGPGQAATRVVGLYTGDLRSYRAHRDVVLVDQRGTGASNPLVCADDSTPLAAALREMFPLELMRRCRDAASKHADLRFYTTPLAMDDLDDVRAALGYDKIDLFGLSYGSRAALVYARQHPEHVNRIVIGGVTPVWAKLPLSHASAAQRALDLMVADAPALRGQLAAAMKRLPAKVTYKGESGTLTAPVFAEHLRRLLYLPLTAREIPKIAEGAARGDFMPLLRTVVGTPPSVADGLYFSITCAEDTLGIDPAEAQRLTAGTLFGDYRVAQQRRVCAEWPRASLPENYWDDVRVDAPVLMLTGWRDPVTPPAWAAAVAQTLPHARNVVIKLGAHVPVGLSNIECWDELVLGFLDGADLDTLDTSCVDTMR
ncbi:MAG TPA: alpha/beta hydrolase [Thermoanaerobaculia bacterium]|jgi:pimeloyl-ACP methyl ester carboxylesterase